MENTGFLTGSSQSAGRTILLIVLNADSAGGGMDIETALKDGFTFGHAATEKDIRCMDCHWNGFRVIHLLTHLP